MARSGGRYPLITSDVAKKILGGHRKVSLDLGLTEVTVVLGDETVTLLNETKLRFDDLRMAAERENAVFAAVDGGLRMVALSDGHFYKLVPTDRAPSLEVDGIRMHRTKRTTPDADAAAKARALGVRSGRVLDTCAGLGYTAQAAVDRGAELVVSIELEAEVLAIAAVNPWSRRLFEDPRIHLLLGDAYALVDTLPRGFFDYVVHDPPRLALAGRLYGSEFYARLFGVLGSGGRLFHYAGEPGARYRRLDIRGGVARRLREAGFTGIRHHPEVLGLVSRKP